MANLIEEGDEVVVGVNGVFGTRLAEVASDSARRSIGSKRSGARIVEPSNSRGGAQRRRKTQAGCGRACGDLDRDSSADRGDCGAGASPWRDDGDRRGDVARVRAGRDRQMGNRRVLQLHAKGYRRAAGAVAGDVQRARDGSGAQAQNEMPLVVLRCRDDRAVLGPRPAVPSHRADHDELRAVRGAADRGRRRVGGAMAAPSRERARSRRDCARWVWSSRRRKATAAATHDVAVPDGIDDAKVRSGVAATLQYRDRRRAGTVQGQDLARSA